MKSFEHEVAEAAEPEGRIRASLMSAHSALLRSSGRRWIATRKHKSRKRDSLLAPFEPFRVRKMDQGHNRWVRQGTDR